MSTLDKLFAVAKAINKGETLKNVETWKSVQGLMIPFSLIFALIPQFLPIDMSDAQINAISYGIATLCSVFATYLVPATSTKVGLSGKSNTK